MGDGSFYEDSNCIIENEQKKESPTTLFIGNLSFTVTSDNLLSIFSTFGEIILCELKTDQDGRTKGFGFIKFKKSGDAILAVNAMNGGIIDGRSVVVNIEK